jgi:hypothetical protein
MQTIQKAGYASRDSFSGIGMFMPYTPARNVNGMKIVPMIVSTLTMSLVLFETTDT